MLTPDCAQIKPLGRLVPMSVHLARELGAISGHGGGDNTAYGSIGTFLHKPVEPLSFRFLRRHPHTETGGERSRWMAARMADQIDRERNHAGNTRSEIPVVEFSLEQNA